MTTKGPRTATYLDCTDNNEASRTLAGIDTHFFTINSESNCTGKEEEIPLPAEAVTAFSIRLRCYLLMIWTGSDFV